MPLLLRQSSNDVEIPAGFCQCGCGRETAISPYTVERDGYVKGVHRRFVRGHSSRHSIITEPSSDIGEIKWAAGLFEGEGTIHVALNTICLSMSQVDIWPLERFLNTVGTGKIYGPYTYGQKKPIWEYRCTGWLRCGQVVDLMWNDLSPRRQQQIENAVLTYQEQ
jgi:hypothetical protein